MSTPDVRVRLTPEGVAEVVAALKKVQAESAAANKSSAGGVNLVNQALRELKSLLPTIGLAAFVAGFVALTKRALETADATGKLQQKVGGTTEEISALTLAFRQNNSNQEELGQLLRQTTLRMDELRTGSAQVPEELSRIGVTIDEIRGLDAPRVLELIATRLANIRDPAERAALATGIFKKNAADLLPALNAIGTQGIDPFIKKARELGVLIDGDLAEAAQRANDAFGQLKTQTEGLATQFAAGLAPQIAAAMEDFSQAVQGDGFNSLREFASFVGFVIRNTISLFTQLGKAVGAIFAGITALITANFDAIDAVLHGRFKDLPVILKRALGEAKTIITSFADDFEQSRDRVSDPGTPKEPRRLPGTTTVPAITPEDKRISDARNAFLRAQLDNELALIKASIQAREDANSQSYQQGLISLQEYFRRRQELAKQAADAEISALRAQRRALLATDFAELQKLTAQRDETRRQALGKAAAPGQQPAAPAAAAKSASNLDADLQARRIKLRQQLADIDTKIQVREIEFERQKQQLQAEEEQAQRELTDQQIAAFAQLNELEGNRHEAFVLNLALEERALIELLQRAGASADSIQETVGRFARARTSQFDFEEVTRKGKAALDSFNRDADQIRRDQEAGIIGQVQGEDRLIELERQRLEILKQLSAEALKAAEATGNEDAIEQAKQFAASVGQIEASYRSATDVVLRFKQGLSEGFREGVRGILENTDKIHSLRDVFEQLGDTILNVFKQISADIISKSLTRSLENAIGIGTSAGGGGGGTSTGFLASLAGFFGKLFGGARAGGLQRFAAGGAANAEPGGRVQGPGTGASDSIVAIVGGRQPVRIANGEYIVREPVVRQPRALAFLHDFNRRGMSALAAPRFAAGGFAHALAAPSSIRLERYATGGVLNAALAASDTKERRPMHVDFRPTIQAPTAELGRRTVAQTAVLFGRELRRAQARDD